MMPVLVSFLPPTHTHLYLPTLLTFARSFNSAVIDDRILELAGDLSEEHVAGAAGPAGEEGGTKWKDIGIWSEADFNFLLGKGLGSMSKGFVLFALSSYFFPRCPCGIQQSTHLPLDFESCSTDPL
jgi:hypothetical protein